MREASAQGVVDEVLPRALYRVKLDDGKHITASLHAVARHTLVSLKPGDRVLVEVASFDPQRGKITARKN